MGRATGRRKMHDLQDHSCPQGRLPAERDGSGLEDDVVLVLGHELSPPLVDPERIRAHPFTHDGLTLPIHPTQAVSAPHLCSSFHEAHAVQLRGRVRVILQIEGSGILRNASEVQHVGAE